MTSEQINYILKRLTDYLNNYSFPVWPIVIECHHPIKTHATKAKMIGTNTKTGKSEAREVLVYDIGYPIFYVKEFNSPSDIATEIDVLRNSIKIMS